MVTQCIVCACNKDYQYIVVRHFRMQGDKQMRMPLHDDYKAEQLLTDVGGNAEGPEEVLTVDEYLMPQKWTEEEKKTDEV